MAAASLARDTAVEPLGDGVFAATVSDAWSAPRGPNGGYIAALVLRALVAAVDDERRHPRSLTLHYLRPPAPGPCEIHTTVERAGRSVASLSVRLRQDGEPMVLGLAALGVPFGSAIDYAAPAPLDGGPPAQLRTPEPADGLPTIAYRTAQRRVFGPRMLSGGEEALTGGWLRLAEPEPVDAAAVAFFTDAWMPAPMARLTTPVAAPTVDLTIHFRAPLPHPGLEPGTPVLARFRSSTSADGYFEEDGEIWAPDGTLLAQSRQLGLLMPPR